VLVLIVLKGPDKGHRFELPDDEPQLIGRSSEALQLKDQTISRRHAELTPDDGQWYINDLQSANGTFVNGQSVVGRRRLQPGDHIRTGSSLFLFGQEAGQFRHDVRMVKNDEIDAHVSAAVASNEDSMIMAVPEPNQGAVLQLKVIYELTQLLGSSVNQKVLLERVMDLVFDHIQADRGFIMFRDEKSSQLEPAVVRHRVPSRDAKADGITVSQTIIQHVIRKGEGVLCSNAMSDQRFTRGDSIQHYAIRSAMCVPIKFKERLFGVLHIDSQIANYTYTEDQLRLLTAVGVQTGLALANAELHEARVHRERLAAMGQTVASLSHSIKNILQGLRGGADVVELGLRKDKMKVVRGGWEIVSRNLDRIFGLTMNMLAYSKQQKPELEMVNIVTLLDEILALVKGQFNGKNVDLSTEFDRQIPPIPLDADGIHQAVLNLLNNALDAVDEDTGKVIVRCEYDSEALVARIKVIDNGRGIGVESSNHMFTPFYSTKGLRGTGLGLVVSKKIIQDHGGKITIESSPSHGTVLTIVLPATAQSFSSSDDTHGPASKDHQESTAISSRKF